MEDDAIARVATVYLKEYGTNAARQAERNANHLQSIGNHKGARNWILVADVIRRKTKEHFHTTWIRDDRES